MPEPLSALAVALFLATVANRLTEALIVPIFDKMKWDKFWLLYIAWIVAGVVVELSGVNLFAGYLANPLAGQILTAIVAGGGANFIADLFNREAKPAVVVNEPPAPAVAAQPSLFK
jgi:hypothetical protein